MSKQWTDPSQVISENALQLLQTSQRQGTEQYACLSRMVCVEFPLRCRRNAAAVALEAQGRGKKGYASQCRVSKQRNLCFMAGTASPRRPSLRCARRLFCHWREHSCLSLEGENFMALGGRKHTLERMTTTIEETAAVVAAQRHEVVADAIVTLSCLHHRASIVLMF